MPKYPILLISAYVLECRNFAIEHNIGNKDVVLLSNGISLKYKKFIGCAMYVCDIGAKTKVLSCVANIVLLSGSIHTQKGNKMELHKYWNCRNL